MNDLALVWLRNDLRLADNPALVEALGNHRRVVPVYIHDPQADGDWATGAASRWWLHQALTALDQDFQARGSKLVVRIGDSMDELRTLIVRTQAAAVYWNRRYEPVTAELDRRIEARLGREAVNVRTCRASVLFEPDELVQDDGSPYRVFTPFWNRMQREWRAPQPLAAPRELPPVDPETASVDIAELGLLPDHPWPGKLAEWWTVGEAAAQQRLDDFIESGVAQYHARRNRPDLQATSRLSPDLHFGHLSPAQLVTALDPAGVLPDGRGPLAWVRELAWREFSIALLHHGLLSPERPMQPAFAAFPWRSPEDYAADLVAWQHGRTGIPMVDAGMRQLWATGWMHNRVRMVVASFLTKNLLVPWQEGERWFRDTLVDADLANNTQGWQWTAGCGPDAAPYFRVFNPVFQAERFDPDGSYVGRWCPELQGLNAKALARLDSDTRRARNYPEPIVDLKLSRARALDAWRQIRNG
ncbi:MAG: deoxyribodipyrimidine photo-lyase [Wenzhouxiangellaceae bacterium]